MDGSGRGRARGRRIIEVLEVDAESGRLVGGRGMIARALGRGINAETAGEGSSAAVPNLGRGTPGRGIPPSVAIPNLGRGIAPSPGLRGARGGVGRGMALIAKHLNGHDISTDEGPKDILERDLDKLEKSNKGCFLRLVLTYFSHEEDIGFLFEKLWISATRNHKMAEIFAMNLKLLTLHKQHGENLRQMFFKKLQETCTSLPDYEAVRKMSEKEKQRLGNFCVFMGQVFFRYRPGLGVQSRYEILAQAAADCLVYLVLLRGIPNLSTLVYQLNLNYKTLNEAAKPKIDRLSYEVHKALLAEEAVECPVEDRLWMLCILDHLSSGQKSTELPHNLSQYYRLHLGILMWEKVAVPSPIELLADLPDDFSENDAQQFHVHPETYNMYKSTEV